MVTLEEKNINIYIVDDDPLLLKILKSKFNAFSKYNIFLFSTGEEFLHQFTNTTFSRDKLSIVVLDYNLSSSVSKAKNGLVILKEIKKYSKGTHVVMLQSYLTNSLSDLLIAEGADICIRKSENYFDKIQTIIDDLVKEKILKGKKRQYQKVFLAIFISLLVVSVFGMSRFLHLF
jgi:DNA-binding NarL/FixJ family response regulator